MAIISTAPVVFYRHAEDLGKGEHDYENDLIKIKLLADVPSQDASNISVAALSANEVSGSGYTAGGLDTVSSWVFSISPTNRAVLDLSDVTWIEDPSGPSNIYSALIYNSVSNRAIAYIDLRSAGQPISLAAGNITISVNPIGLYDLGFA